MTRRSIDRLGMARGWTITAAIAVSAQFRDLAEDSPLARVIALVVPFTALVLQREWAQR